jgi:hypothetical protein
MEFCPYGGRHFTKKALPTADVVAVHCVELAARAAKRKVRYLGERL